MQPCCTCALHKPLPVFFVPLLLLAFSLPWTVYCFNGLSSRRVGLVMLATGYTSSNVPMSKSCCCYDRLKGMLCCL